MQVSGNIDIILTPFLLVPLLAKEQNLRGLEKAGLFKVQTHLKEPGFTAQFPWLEAEPRLACMKVGEVAERKEGGLQADPTHGGFRNCS